MQLVIDIPESILNTIQADEMISREQLAVLQMHILNGTPLPQPFDLEELLNKIRAEIEGLTYYWCEVNPKSVIDDALQIIDKYKAERSDKE